MLQYDAPTKVNILRRKLLNKIDPFFDLAFGKRPKEELFDLKNDPYQLNNLSYDKRYLSIKDSLSSTLNAYLESSGDPRENGIEYDWDSAYYFEEKDKKPKPSKKYIDLLGLKSEYNYLKWRFLITIITVYKRNQKNYYFGFTKVKNANPKIIISTAKSEIPMLVRGEEAKFPKAKNNGI